VIEKLKMEKIEPISDEEYNRILKVCENHINNLKLITQSTRVLPEGNIYYRHQTFDLFTEKIPTQKNIMTLAKLSNKILEIGFNMGHSCLFMLVANPACKIDCIDICEYPYTEYCFNYLKNCFPGRLRLFKGSSHEVLKSYEEPLVDMCHIDGCHEFHMANGDFFSSKDKVKIGGFIVFDDTWMGHLMWLWKGYIQTNVVSEVEIIPQNYHLGAGHSIGRLVGPKLKIAVCTLALGDIYKNVVKYGQLSKVKYCERQGYEFRDDADVYDSSRPHAWSKVQLILKCLYENKHDYIVWIDADSFIMNSNLKLEHFISRFSEGRDILVAKDRGDAVNSITEQVNTGVIFIKNTIWAKEFFEGLYLQTDFINSANWEQDAFIHMYENNIMKAKEHITILPSEFQTEFNSYHAMFRYGQFLVHLAGCSKYKDNGARLKHMMDMFCPLRMEEDTDFSYADRMRCIRQG
jgi:hypothetical protein